MDDYLSKPSRLCDIEQALQRAASTRVHHSAVDPSISTAMVSDGVQWNRAAALERLGGDERLLDELIGVFFEEYPALARQMKEAFSQRDWVSLRESAHRLKGSLGALGLTATCALAQEIESAGLVQDATTALSLTDQLFGEIEILQDVMRPRAVAGAAYD